MGVSGRAGITTQGLLPLGWVGFKQARGGMLWTSSLMPVPTPAHRSWGAVARMAMAQAYRLGLLLALLLPVVGALMPGTVVRLNEAVLSYGKRCAAGLSCACLHTCMCTVPCVCICVCLCVAVNSKAS